MTGFFGFASSMIEGCHFSPPKGSECFAGVHLGPKTAVCYREVLGSRLASCIGRNYLGYDGVMAMQRRDGCKFGAGHLALLCSWDYDYLRPLSAHT